MTTLREAAQQALEAMEREAEYYLQEHSEYNEVLLPAMDVLRAALAEPVQEPVAWIQPNHLQKARRAPFLCRVEPTKRMVDFVALYTAPPQRKLPATIDEIFDRMNKAPKGVFYGHDPMTIWMEAWRAAEQHGIKDD